MFKQRQYYAIDPNSLFMPWLVALLVMGLGAYFDLYPQWRALNQLRLQTVVQQQHRSQMIADVVNRPIYQQWVEQFSPVANESMIDWLAKFSQYFAQHQLEVYELNIDNSDSKSSSNKVHIIVQGSYTSVIQLLQHFIQRWDSWRLQQWYLQKQDDEKSMIQLVIDIQYA